LKGGVSLSPPLATAILRSAIHHLPVSAIFLYRLLEILGLPFLVVYFLLRALKLRAIPAVRAASGFLPAPTGRRGRRHLVACVSVGEVLAAVELLRG